MIEKISSAFLGKIARNRDLRWLYTTEESQTSIDGELRKTLKLNVKEASGEVEFLLLELCAPIDLKKLRHLYTAMEVFDEGSNKPNAGTHLNEQYIANVVGRIRQRIEMKHDISRQMAYFGIAICIGHSGIVESGVFSALADIVLGRRDDEATRLKWFMEKAQSCTTEGQDAYGWLKRGLRGDEVPE